MKDKSITDLVNRLGRTEVEQQQLEAELKQAGSLWPDMTLWFGAYDIPCGEWLISNL